MAWLLIIANVWLVWQSVVSSFLGWLLAVIVTFVLSIAAIVKAIKALINKRNRVRNAVGILLNLLALIIYLGFTVWMGNLVLLALIGAEYSISHACEVQYNSSASIIKITNETSFH